MSLFYTDNYYFAGLATGSNYPEWVTDCVMKNPVKVAMSKIVQTNLLPDIISLDTKTIKLFGYI